MIRSTSSKASSISAAREISFEWIIFGHRRDHRLNGGDLSRSPSAIAFGRRFADQYGFEMAGVVVELSHLPVCAGTGPLREPGLRPSIAFARLAAHDHDVDASAKFVQRPPQVSHPL